MCRVLIVTKCEVASPPLEEEVKTKVKLEEETGIILRPKEETGIVLKPKLEANAKSAAQIIREHHEK